MMELKEPILKLLGKTYEPLKMVELKFGRYNLAVKPMSLAGQSCCSWIIKVR